MINTIPKIIGHPKQIKSKVSMLNIVTVCLIKE